MTKVRESVLVNELRPGSMLIGHDVTLFVVSIVRRHLDVEVAYLVLRSHHTRLERGIVGRNQFFWYACAVVQP